MQADLFPFDRAPEPLGMLVNPRALAGAAELVLALLLLVLFAYRRRTYVLAWSAGWALTAASMLALARPYASAHAGRAIVGLSQLLAILAALAFVVSADSYRQRPRIARIHLLVLMPLAIWFVMAPLALGVRSVVVPGHLIAAAVLAAAATAYGALVRRTRLIGAGLTGGALLLLATGHVWTAAAVAGDLERWNAIEIRALLPLGVLSILAALSMHFLAFEDMTLELRQANRRLEKAQTDLRHLVVTDPLTACHNRRFFDGIIGRELKRHRRYGIPLSILFIDVDNFKAVNDTLGHEMGDRVLCAVAAFLARHVREADYLFRWGGDEFLILISCTEEDARRKGTELAGAFGSSREMAGLPRGVGLSVGYAEIQPTAKDASDAIKSADERMYEDKERGRRTIGRR
jgi:diguanylate cyclase (GGDEF)-like protein